MSTVVITGANRGIGLEYCKQFLKRGDSVIALCRDSSKELSALGCRIEEGIDVSIDACVTNIIERLSDISKIDVLVNNAGLLTDETIEDLDYDAIRKQFEINTLGPLRVTDALKDKLGAGSKIVMMTSRMGSVTDNTSGSRYGYRISKAALNIASVSLSHDLKSQGVAVAILHPGYVRTEMTGMGGLINPEESVHGLMQVIDALTLENSGTFWHSNGEVLPW
ncbi:MAG: SDR family NAD(P)-dependent oxidoreductase [Gammaproteobacteria bacterium]|nr:SDR family NAD(P)-dependent oxidoreductase [Gammaproteobacteria bacterium]